MVCMGVDTIKSRRHVTPQAGIAAVTLALAAGVAFSETPDRDLLSGKLFMTRPHYYAAGARSHLDGLWTFDPVTGDSEKLRPLALTNETDLNVHHWYMGEGHYLAAVGDRLVVQTWPHFLEFEAPSWRLLRRYPPGDGFFPLGWAVQGPMLSAQTASAAGLESGLYGFAHCVLNQATRSGGGATPPRECEAHSFPGWDEDRTRGDGSVILHRGLGPLEHELAFVAETNPYAYRQEVGYIPPSLTFDRTATGFWRAGPRTIEFLPVVDGVVQPASIVQEPALPPSDDEDWGLYALHVHAGRGRLFGTSDVSGARFFSLDRDLSLIETYELDYGRPNALTSLASPPTAHEQTIPAISNASGRLGTYWTTELWLFNPSSEATTVNMRRVASPDVYRVVDLPPHGSLKIDDILGWMGGGPHGDGVANDALVLTSPSRWGEQLVATSRTSTPNPEGGSYGVAVSAVPDSVGYSNHLPHDQDGSTLEGVAYPSLLVSNLTPDRRTPGQYRHNIGIVNDDDAPVTIELLWGFMDPGESQLAGHRPPEALQQVSVPPHSTKIVNLEQLFSAGVRDGWPPRVAVFGDRPTMIWYSMVDNTTGDGTFVPFTNFHYQTYWEYNRSVLPVVAHVPGKEDTFWKTDLYGFQGAVYATAYSDDITYDQPLTFFHPQKRASQCGGAALGGGEISAALDGGIGMPLNEWVETMTEGDIPPPFGWEAERGWRTVFPDVVHLFAECEGETKIKGGLEISTASWMSGYSRTYTSREDGGTYGGMLPLYPPNGWPVQHFAGVEVSDEFRINVGFFNGDHDHAITHRLTLYRADGTEVTTTEFTLGSLNSKLEPLERLLGLDRGSLEDGTYGLTVVPLDDAGNGVEGRSWAYVTLVDNLTGDSTILW